MLKLLKNIKNQLQRFKRKVSFFRRFNWRLTLRKLFLPLCILFGFGLLALLIIFIRNLPPKAPNFKKSSGEIYQYEAKNKLFHSKLGLRDEVPVISFSVSEFQNITFLYQGEQQTTPNIKVEGKEIIFEGVEKNIDLRYQTLPTGLKEEIILRQKREKEQEANVFLFSSTFQGAHTKESIKGMASPIFFDDRGEYLFHFEKPFAIDAAGNRTDEVSLQIEDKANSKIPSVKRSLSQETPYLVRLTVDENWLNDEARVYPITIDPTVVHDTTSEFAVGQFDRSRDTQGALATGGTITYSGGYTIHTFTSSGTFTPDRSINVEALVVGGGGGGGWGTGAGGGGGAGGLLTGALSVTAQAYTVTVGSGGAGGTTFPNNSANGQDSIFSTITSLGGGKGNSYPTNGSDGGSGGGGANRTNGGLGTVGQGNNGGNGNGDPYYAGGGGGGAGAVGANGSGSTAGNGGIGVASSISGTSIFYAGGGGGGRDFFAGRSPNGGSGGNGGGGASGTDGAAGTAGTANTGGGGGGGSQGSGGGAFAGGAGGSGIVIIRYLNSQASNLESYYQELPTDQYTVGLWHMNEASGNLLDSSGNSLTGTATGTTVVSAKLNNGRTFNGTSDSASAGTSTKLDFTTGFTIEAWVNPNATQNSVDSAIVAKISTWPYNGYMLWYNGGTLDLYINGAIRADSTTSVPAGVWTHVTTVWDGSQAKIYINGTLDVSSTYSTAPTSSGSTFYIGRYSDAPRFFTGTIDEVRISNIARTPEEIRVSASRRPASTYISDIIDLSDVFAWSSLSWNEFGVATGDGETLKSSTNLVAQWNFNETSGTTATNNAGSCGTSCNGTLTGFDSTASQDADPDSSWTANNRRWGAGGLMFDGLDTYITVPDHDSLSFGSTGTDSPFSIGMWINPRTIATATGDWLINKRNADASDEYQVVLTTGGGISFVIMSGNGNTIGRKAFNFIKPGGWYHVVATYDGSKTNAGIKIYINGQRVDSSDNNVGTYTGMSNGPHPITIGKPGWSSSLYFDGTIDSTAIFARELSSSEIMSNYQAGNIELQTRVGSDTSPDDGSWEAWKSTTGETAIDSMDTSSEHWSIDNNQNSSSTINKIGAVNTGTGNDGACIMNNGTKTLDTTVGSSVCNSSARSTAYAANFSDTTLESAGETSVTVSATPTGIVAGDEILIINLQGTSTSYENVGKYETHIVSSVSTNTLNFTDYPLKHTYDGTTQKIMVQRVPNFGAITICGGNTGSGCSATATLTTSAWNGTKNGVLFFRSNGTVTVNSGGTITTTGLGFRAGSGGSSCIEGEKGESFNGRLGGGGGDVCYAGSDDVSGTIGGGGGGGDYACTSTAYAYGGGGGYGSPGSGGNGSGAASSGVIGGWALGGAGGAACGGGACSGGGGGGGGGTYGQESLSTVFLGSGSAGSSGWWNGACQAGYSGAAGGGAINISSSSIVVNGTITANGNAASQSGNGSGGTVKISATDVALGSSLVTANGGTGGAGVTGGAGRIAIFYTDSLSGSTSPVSYVKQLQSTIKQEGASAMQIQTGRPEVDSGTVGLWHLDETGGTGAYLKDSSANANNGTPTGTTVVNGFSGKGRSFNGSSDIISLGNPSSLQITGAITAEAWVKTSAGAAFRGLVSKMGTGATFYAYSLREYGTGYAQFGVSGTGSNFINAVGTTLINDGKWHHIVGTYIPSTSVSIYVDGVLETTTVASVPAAIFNSSGNAVIGCTYTTPNECMSGTIDEAKISNVARSAEEIAESYRSGRDHYINKTISSADLSDKTTLPFYVAGDRPGSYLSATIGESAFANYQPNTSTLALWHLDEQSGSGAYIKDSSGNARSGTPTGTTSIQGRIGKARNFNGTSDYVDVGNISSLGFERTNPFSVGFWIKAPATSSHYFPVINKLSWVAGAKGWRILSAYTGTSLVFTLADNHTVTDISLTVDNVLDNNWHHVVFTYDGNGNTNGVSGYLDGVLKASGGGGNLTSTTTNTTSVTIGGSTSTAYGIGQLDEVRIDNIVRTPTEIRQAYEIGARTHSVTIDFGAKLDAGNLITGSGDLGFTVDATYYGLQNKGDMLFKGDKVIVRENYNGTEYIAQGTVDAITASTGATSVSAWDSGSTFPSGGYTVNASVFKWQREYWNINNETLDAHTNAITNLTLRLTDGNEGRTIWLDDLRSNSSYLTNPAGSTITSSTGSRYAQYRAILSSWDEAVTATLSTVTLDYVTNTMPTTPTLDLPSDTATNQILSTVLKTTGTDANSDYLRYKIELCTDVAMTVACQAFNQTSSQTGWSGQNADSSQAYTSGTQASYTLQTDLLSNTIYYWRSYAIDPAGTGIWSATQATPYSFTTSAAPGAPTVLYAEGLVNPTAITDLTPEFSAIHNDSNGDNAIYYEIEVNTTNDFTGTVMWDSGKLSMTPTANAARSPNISYAGTTLNFNGTTYYWRIRFWDTFNLMGSWSAVNNFSMNNSPNIPSLDTPLQGNLNTYFKPTLLTTATDADSDYLRYKIQLCTDLAMTTSCQTFDQTASQVGWSGQNTQTNTAYTSGTQATYTLQTDLIPNTTYYWRSYAIDPAGSNTWSATQSTPFSFVTMATPLPASSCFVQESITDDQLLIVWTDNATNEDFYEVQRSVDGGAWTTFQTSLAANTNNLLDTTIGSGHTYQYRIAPYFTGPYYSPWCTASTLNLGVGLFNLEGIRASGLHFN